MDRDVEIPCALASVIESSLNAIVMIDARGLILEFNAAAESAFGYARAEMMGVSIESFIVPDAHRKADQERLLRFIHGERSTPGAIRVEVDGIAKGGGVVPLEVTITGLEIEGAKRFICTLRDLSPEQRDEEALQDSRHQLELAVDGAKLGTWTFDIKTGKTWYSDRSKQMYGLSVDTEMTTEVIRQSVLPEYWDEVSAPYLAGFGDRERVEVEYRVRCPDGSIRWIYSLGAPLRDDDGVPQTVNGIHLDITDRKHAEEELEKTRQQLELAVEGAGLGIWTVDPRTGATWYSDRSRDLWGVGRELNLNARMMRQYIHPDDWEKVLEPYREDFPDDQVHFEHRLVWPNGDI